MTAKTKKLLTIALTALALAAFVITPLAWFASYWNSDGSPFQPGGNANLPSVMMWMYQTPEDIGATTGNGQWISQSITSDTDSFTVPGLDSKTDITVTKKDLTVNGTVTSVDTYTFNNLPLHFGKVDNLISLQNDNIVYMRLEVTTSISGCNELTVNLGFYDATPTTGLTAADLYSSVHLYGVDTEISTNDIIRIEGAQLQELIDFPTNGELADSTNEYCQFMQIAVCVSTQALAPSDAAFADLVFDNFDNVKHTEFDPIGGAGISVDLQEALKPKTEDDETTTPEDGDEAETVAESEFTPPEKYYIYLKIAPRLEFFVLQEHLLDKFVPSYLFFDTKLELELH